MQVKVTHLLEGITTPSAPSATAGSSEGGGGGGGGQAGGRMDEISTNAPWQRRNSNIAKATLPTDSSASANANKNSAEWHRECHDVYNLVVLIPIVFMTAINFDWEKIMKGSGPETAWNGEYFWCYWVLTTLYFVVDLSWVALIPTCVKSPGTIIKHHFIALFYLLAPIVYPQYRWFMGGILSVEINTWFLIARRFTYKRSPEYFSASTVAFASNMFYFTWVLIRCIVYPAILFTQFEMAYEAIIDTGMYFHLPMIFIPIHFSFCVLNFIWTYDLFKPMVTKWWRNENRQIGIATGL